MVQASIPNDSTLPRDSAVNTWHFRGESIDPVDDADQAIDALAIFYAAIDGLYSKVIGSPAVFKAYNLGENPPRVPIFSNIGPMTPGTGQPLPNEVAICLSYHAEPISGVPAGRRRGRIYLGPWDSAVTDDGGGDAIVDDGVVGAISAAAATFLASFTGTNCHWAVFSPTIAGPTPWTTGDLVAATFDVVGGWVDNAFDTVRSRGALASDRVLFP